MAQENNKQGGEIRYLNPVSVDVKKKKYCPTSRARFCPAV